ncbi:MAG: bacillithiol biosynthesis cysteine-adding enzyme BshC [Ignavibacterium sp.]
MFINFSDIPGHQNLFLDYLYEFDNVKKYYKKNFRNKEEFPKHFHQISKSNYYQREKITEIILNQYKNRTPSEKTLKNIEQIKSDNTLMIITGQQLGILGGPFYTFYKIITAIKLASFLNQKYDEYNFIPIFWLEGDDHDFTEISSIKIFDNENNLAQITYNDNLPLDENRGNIGKLLINENINQFFEELKRNFRESEFKEKNLDFLKSIYKSGESFSLAFSDLMFHLFDKEGLILFDPQDKNVKELLKPIFLNEIKNFRKHTEKLIEVSAELEEVYHAQVKVRPINLFMNYENGRYLIEPLEPTSLSTQEKSEEKSDKQFRLKGKRIKFLEEELINQINNFPENFSPNVLFRPICQDYLFPTSFYIGGPSEVSYFAQVMPLYELFNVNSPIIYPRSSATLIEKNIQTIIEKYNINLLDCFISKEKVTESILNNISSINIEEVFDRVSKNIFDSNELLNEYVMKIDQTLSGAVERNFNKIKNHIDELKQKTFEAEKRKNETVMRQLNKIFNTIFPNNNLQEREINYFYFANKYGLDFIDFIFKELEIEKFEHQIININ